MRAIANVCNHPKVKRVMLYECKDWVYLFLYNTENDSACFADYLNDTIDVVKDICLEDYGVQKGDWRTINDPLDGCQDDWIYPVRVKGRNLNKPEWGKFEKLIDNEWVEI